MTTKPSAAEWEQAVEEAGKWEFEDSIAVCDWIKDRANELAASRGEVAVTAQEAVPVAFVRWVEDDAQGGNGGPTLVWNPKFDGWSLTKSDGMPQDCALYTTPPATVPISELRALREKWREFSWRNQQPWPDVSADEYARGKQAGVCANELAALCAKFGE